MSKSAEQLCAEVDDVNQALDRFPNFADGTESAPGGPAWVGEKGKELVHLPRGSQVIPNDVAIRMASGGGITINNYSDAQPSAQRAPNGDVTITIRKLVDQAVGESLSSGAGRRVLGEQFAEKPFTGR